MSGLACESCGDVGVVLDVDMKVTPPQVVCRRKCAKRSQCDRCKRRTPSKVLQQRSIVEQFGWRHLCPRCDRG